MTFDFTNASDDEINSQIAVTCDGYADMRRQFREEARYGMIGEHVETFTDHPNGNYYATYLKTRLRCKVPNYLDNTNLIIELLRKMPSVNIYLGADCHVKILSEHSSSSRPNKVIGEAIAFTFTRAAAGALLLAYGVQLT